GRVVTKDELMAAVWPQVIVNDDALAQCVRDIRKALGDEDQRFVKTVPRRGYLFRGEVKEERHPLPAPAPTALRRRWAALAALLVVTVLGGLAWSYFGAGGSIAVARDPRPSVAVL